jgi:predicted DsbA family dithiol-disulfide isomerase
VTFRPYQLDPQAPTAPAPLLDALRKKFGPQVRGVLQRVTDAAKGEGIDIAWERAVSVNTLTAHRLLGLARREYGPAVQRALVETLFDAHFSQGGDVSDRELLTELAASAGMERARVRDYLAAGEGMAELRSELAEAHRLGIRAVPTFVFEGRYALQGAHPTSDFLEALEEVAARTATVPIPEDDVSGDACADGRCV